MPEPIPYDQAMELLDSGEWVRDGPDLQLYIDELIQYSFDIALSDISVVMELNRQGKERNDTSPDDLPTMIERLIRRWAEKQEYLLPTISSNRTGSQYGRTGRAAILKISPTIKRGRWSGLAIIGSALAMANLSAIGLLATILINAPNFKDLFAALANVWEKLDDPKEAFLFELIHMLHCRYSVINYDAVTMKDFQSAYGHLAPSLEEIEEAIRTYHVPEAVPAAWRDRNGAVWQDDLLKTLQELKRRNVLEEHSGRWNITF